MNRNLKKTMFFRAAPDLERWLTAEAKRRSTKAGKLSVSEVVRDILEEKRLATTGQKATTT